MKKKCSFTRLERTEQPNAGLGTRDSLLAEPRAPSPEPRAPSPEPRAPSPEAGFTLIEVLISTVIVVVGLLSLLGVLAYSISLTSGSRQATLAQYYAEREMEEIGSNDYLSIRNGNAGLGLAAYTNNGGLLETPFVVVDGAGNPVAGYSGTVYAAELAGATNALMRIKVVVCYQQNNRLFGEDTNLNGSLDGDEDTNGNGELDSPCAIEKVIVNTEV